MSVELTTYRAKDRRVYNGALCSDMQKEVNHTSNLEKIMHELDPTAGCTYFPMEKAYMVFTNTNILEFPDLKGPPKILTNNFHAFKQEALVEAIITLRGMK